MFHIEKHSLDEQLTQIDDLFYNSFRDSVMEGCICEKP